MGELHGLPAMGSHRGQTTAGRLSICLMISVIFSTDLCLEVGLCSISSCLPHTSPFALSFKECNPDLFTATSLLLFTSQLIWL